METTTKRRTGAVVAIVAVIVVAVGAFVYARFFAGAAPAEVALSTPSAAPSVTGSAGAATDGFDGTWTVDAATGSLAEGSSTFAGYRIDEELSGVGANTAVGRTQSVTGSMTIDGSQVTALDITVDMTTLRSDDDRRDGQLDERGLETSSFPTATFALTEPIDVGEEPAVAEVIETTGTGELTLHGVTNQVEVPIQAQWTGSHIEVLVSFDVALADYQIEAPVGFLVLSVADTGAVEMHLLFAKEGS